MLGESTMEKKGVSALIYDNAGTYYFLIVHRAKEWQGWEFPKFSLEYDQELNEEQEQKMLFSLLENGLGMKKFKVLGKLVEQRKFMEGDKTHAFTVFVVEALMNIPVNLNSEKHDTYLWTKYETVMEKLTWESEKEIFDKAYTSLKKGNGS
jgi:hypothetical protein